jgi:hypothetical protein
MANSKDGPSEAHQAEVLRQLGDAFYEADPGSHFRARALWLAEQADASALVHRPETPPNRLTADLWARLPGWQSSTPPVDPNDHSGVLTVEAFSLSHHAGESLLRHVFAHWDVGQVADSPGWHWRDYKVVQSSGRELRRYGTPRTRKSAP